MQQMDRLFFIQSTIMSLFIRHSRPSTLGDTAESVLIYSCHSIFSDESFMLIYCLLICLVQCIHFIWILIPCWPGSLCLGYFWVFLECWPGVHLFLTFLCFIKSSCFFIYFERNFMILDWNVFDCRVKNTSLQASLPLIFVLKSLL